MVKLFQGKVRGEPKSYDVWRHSLWLYGLFFALGMGAATFGFHAHRAIAAPAKIDAGTERPAKHSSEFSEGAWGTLEAEPVALQGPNQVLADGGQRMEPVRWVFAGYTCERLTGLLQSCQFGEAERAYLLNKDHWEPLSNGYAITPPDEVVRGLGAASRARLYWTLATNRANYAEMFPFSFPAEGIDERFADSGLPREKIDAIAKLAYPGYGYLWLAVDRPLLQSLNRNELPRFLRAIYSCPTWLLRVKLDSGTDVDALLRYWGTGREKKLRPLLQSLAMGSGTRSIGVGALLPPFAQSRLYSYPDPEADPEVVQEDCFYTAMNFFEDPPDGGFTNITYTRKVLESKFAVDPPPGRFGDVVVVYDAAGNGIHACVYIADDFVFTKNGYRADQPWVIMKVDDMLACFPSDTRHRVIFWHRKGT